MSPPTTDAAAAARRLVTVKTIHTLAWAFFASCIIAIPFFALANRLVEAMVLIGISLVEVAIVAANGMHCPLTAVAARYTSDRRDNFDIYLPEWLARHNKRIFGTLLVIGILLTLLQWLAGGT